MEKAIHFYVYDKVDNVYHSWRSTKNQIRIGKSTIHTTQMGLLSTELFELGYRIFIHESDIDCYEIVLGSGNKRTDKAIRPAHNLFKMWQAGAFMKGLGD